MTDADSSGADSPAPADVFGLVADETRMDILHALAEAPYDEYHGVLTFSELRERAGVRDSGQFNYHLDKLVGRFVREEDDGYALSYLGELLYRTVTAGFFTHEPDLSEFDTGSECLDCGAGLEAWYDEGRVRVECPDCGRGYEDVEFPPSAVDARAGDDLLEAFDQYVRHNVLLMSRDICMWCGGRMPGEFRSQTDRGLTGESESSVYVARSCENCHGFMFMTPGEHVLYHPAVVSFFYERGVDVTSRPLWELPFAASDEAVEVRSEDPWEVAVTVTCDGDEMALVLDGDAEVVAVEDEPR